jgi:hypothetical protein
MRFVLALAVLAALQGCASRVDPLPSDGSRARRITWVITDDPDQTCREVSRKFSKRVMLYKTLGCADWSDPENCVIYTRAPVTGYDKRTMETMGHEMLHCFAGNFHRHI